MIAAWWTRHWQRVMTLGITLAFLGINLAVLGPASWTRTADGIITRAGLLILGITWWFRPKERKP